ncbi:MAG: hypothetical protein ACM3UZ_15005 [Acidobacteriota bacterium]
MMLLSDLYEEQKIAYQAMLEVSHNQLVWASKKDHDDYSFAQFQALLDKRQNLINQIDQLILKIRDLQVELRLEGGSTAAESEKIRQYNDLLMSLATNIKAKDDECDIIIKSKLDKMTKKIGNLKKNQTAAKAYVPQHYQDEGFFYDHRK